MWLLWVGCLTVGVVRGRLGVRVVDDVGGRVMGRGVRARLVAVVVVERVLCETVDFSSSWSGRLSSSWMYSDRWWRAMVDMFRGEVPPKALFSKPLPNAVFFVLVGEEGSHGTDIFPGDWGRWAVVGVPIGERLWALVWRLSASPCAAITEEALGEAVVLRTIAFSDCIRRGVLCLPP